MGICADNSEEKEFYTAIQGMLGELIAGKRFSEALLKRMKAAYQAMTQERQRDCLSAVYEMMRENYAAAIYFMGVLLQETGDQKIIRFVTKLLLSKQSPLWERLNDSIQFRSCLFLNGAGRDYAEYRRERELYEGMLQEMHTEIGCAYAMTPFETRKKKVILVASQLVNAYHAPTGYVMQAFRSLARLGYEVECFICHCLSVEGYWDWNKRIYIQNIMYKTGPFVREFAGVQIKGHNFELQRSNYIETLRMAVEMVYERRPEYVLEMGSETMLAGLCRGFTTVVTMGMTGRLPVTNAQIIAFLAKVSDKERALWDTLLEKEQTVVSVYITTHEFLEALHQKVSRKDLGIPEEAFVLVLAGNRLDLEVKEAFERILFQMLDLSKQIRIAVFGRCPAFQKRMLEGSRADRFYFLGHRTDFKHAVGVGDVFVNPPRQGGGTGGLFAVMEETPVVTLGGCDVAEMVGDRFVCQSMDEMPELIRRYMTDQEFMQVQKENCRKAAANRNVDQMEAFRKICDAVKSCS